MRTNGVAIFFKKKKRFELVLVGHSQHSNDTRSQEIVSSKVRTTSLNDVCMPTLSARLDCHGDFTWNLLKPSEIEYPRC
jgi:hypothetical protein